MSEYAALLAAAIGAAGVLAGVWLTQRHQARAETAAALAEFLAEVDAVALLVRRATRMPRWIAATNSWLERRVPLFDALLDDLTRATLARSHAQLERRLHVAANRVLLLASPPLKQTVVEALQLLQVGQSSRDEGWLERWIALRDTLQYEARHEVGTEPSRRRRHRRR